MSKPQIVLLPGAWHTPAHLVGLGKSLEEAGYTVHCNQLPSVGSDDNPPPDLTRDIAALQETVTTAIADGNDVLVVPHSWSGIIASSGLHGYGKKEREAKGEKGGVIRTAYMCAFLVPEGVSLLDALQHQIPEWWYPKGDLTYPTDPKIFYNDLPEAEQQMYFAMCKTHAYGTKKAKSTGASWKDIPSWYLITEDDLAIPAFAQDLMTGTVQQLGGDMKVERIKSGHSPWLSHPDFTVNWVRRAAGEDLEI
ncbi:Alpha/beta hydrolase fold-1 [Lophiotrema nucula]|uniref:Alpha/beta hydrolase fold-1 n=1 Tax=Lophiotrema nucula TaxID=690887 RepID=A0A6A5ZHC4_9PLEO|nr:Alpha/beta hydrolase fold-1 [Lophiotrema nucula]